VTDSLGRSSALFTRTAWHYAIAARLSGSVLRRPRRPVPPRWHRANSRHGLRHRPADHPARRARRRRNRHGPGARDARRSRQPSTGGLRHQCDLGARKFGGPSERVWTLQAGDHGALTPLDGPRTRPDWQAGSPNLSDAREPHEEMLARSPFRCVHRLVYEFTRAWTIEQTIGYLYSTSLPLRQLLGDRRAAFEQVVTDALLAIDPSGQFIEPVALEVLTATKG
jgi:hypothetical protein